MSNFGGQILLSSYYSSLPDDASPKKIMNTDVYYCFIFDLDLVFTQCQIKIKIIEFCLGRNLNTL